MNFIFKIFGVPHIFDLYQGTETETSYFQPFYDGSKENAKLTIHRMTSGQISYSYLRYNLISSSGRPNAFLGMSIVFNQEYCYDVSKLYRLFDSIYNDVILKNKTLLEAINGNPNAQAKFLVSTFKEQEAEVRNIENIIQKNIESVFANDIRAIDSNFKQGKPNLIRKLNVNKVNEAILDALQNYSWVSISPEYNGEENILSLEAIANLDETIEEVQKSIANISIGALKGADVRKDIRYSWEQIRNGKETIKPYLQIQPELLERNNKIRAVQKQLEDLDKAVADKGETGIGSRDIDTGDKGNNGNNTQTLPPIPWWNKYKPKLIAAAAVVFVLAVVLYWLYPKKSDTSKEIAGTSSTPKDNSAEPTQKGNDSIINYHKLRAEAEFHKTKTANLPKIKCYNDAIKELNKAQKYDSKGEIEAIKEDYKQKAVAYYEKEIDNATKDKQLEYANMILKQLDPNNLKAKGITNNQGRVVASKTDEKGKVSTAKKSDNKENKVTTTNNQANKRIQYKYDANDMKGSWTVVKLLGKMRQSANSGSWQVVKSAANAIINAQKQQPDIATAQQLQQAITFLQQANTNL